MGKKWIACLLTACMVYGLAGAQQADAYRLLREVKNRYAAPDNYRADVVYKVYKGHTSTATDDIQSGEIELYKGCSRFVMGRTEMVYNKKYNFRVDREFREIDIHGTEGTPLPPGYANFDALDSLLRKNKALSFRQDPKGNVWLYLDFSADRQSEYQKVTLQLSPGGELSKLVFYYRWDSRSYGVDESYLPRVEIEYRNQTFNAGLNEARFSEKQYFREENRAVALQPEYKNFKLFYLP